MVVRSTYIDMLRVQPESIHNTLPLSNNLSRSSILSQHRRTIPCRDPLSPIETTLPFFWVFSTLQLNQSLRVLTQVQVQPSGDPQVKVPRNFPVPSSLVFGCLLMLVLVRLVVAMEPVRPVLASNLSEPHSSTATGRVYSSNENKCPGRSFAASHPSQDLTQRAILS